MKQLWLLSALAVVWTAGAQVPNPSFEQGGGNAPDGWKLSAPPGEWAGGGRTGARCVAVTGSGGDSNFWRCDGAAFEPSQLYRFSFYARCATGTTGGLISGPSFANRDLPVGEAWERKSFVFKAPTVVPPGACLRLGHWRMKGTAMFDDVELRPVQAVHARVAGVELGEGESVYDSAYRFHAQFGGDGGNYARPLDAHTAGFNSNRWTFGPGGYVVYKHQVGSHTQRNGRVTVNIGHYERGKCMIEMSFDRLTWTSVDEMTGLGQKTVELPARMFPAGVVYVRLRAESTDKDKPKAVSFQVSQYTYEAQLAGRTTDGRGRTDFVEIQQSDRRLNAVCETLGDPLPGGDHNATWRLQSPSDDMAKVLATLEVWRGNQRVSKSSKGVKLFPGHSETVELSYDVRDAGNYEMRFVERDLQNKRDLFSARVPLSVPLLFASDYGWRLSDEKSKVALWWCESLRKISRERPAPKADAQAALSISAARNERESFQLAINPLKSLPNLTVDLSDLRGPRGAKIPSGNIAVHRVAYVRVETPTDETGVAEEWPDPLPPLAPGEAFAAEVGHNTTLWFTVYVPEDAPAGDYTGMIELKEKTRSKSPDLSSWKATVPLRVHVWNFTLPKETRLKTALGVSIEAVKAYHNLTTDEELEAVWDQYMRNFAAHRISPYWPMGRARIGVQFEKSAGPPRAKLDFAAFDAAAARYLDGLGFNTFRLPLSGLGGGGQGKPWHDGEFGGFKQGTPEYEALWGDYARQIADHLEQKGWLRKAYLYWYDEPERSDYAPVRRNNEQIKRLAPKLARMLTEQPEAELTGAVDIWCPVTPNYRADICHERQRAGDHVWWYICCSPHAPYCTEFIDHAAVELRTWLWQTWGYGVEGILIWETNFWNQPARLKSPARQNPWEDPMSYSENGTWGNGDGRFIYPPNHDNDRKQKFLDGPVNSIRWEILRDGVEDYEYFALLRELLKSKPDPAAEALLKAPPSVFTDMTHFSTDPAPLLQHREKVARAIERLSGK